MYVYVLIYIIKYGTSLSKPLLLLLLSSTPCIALAFPHVHRILAFPRLAEFSAEFTVPLSDATCREEESVTLECEVSLPDTAVVWLKNGEEIKPDDRVDIVVEGTVHRMTIKKSYVEDSAEYTVVLKDEESSAKLVVEGVFCV